VTLRRDVALWLVAVMPLLMWLLHASAIFPLTWEQLPLTAFQTSSGFTFAVPLDTNWMSREITGDSPAQVTENGIPLSRANAPLDDIAKRGEGRFAVQDRLVYLSTSDNSDPRANGRRYVLSWPTKPGGVITSVCFLLAGAATLLLVIRRRALVWSLLFRQSLWPSVAIFLVLTIVSRWWFFSDFRVPGLYGDSTSYYALVQIMDAGRWPQFGIRTPGYPLFLKLVYSLSNTLMAVMVVQNVAAILACLALIYALHVWLNGRFTLWAALGMAVFTTGLWSFENDTSLMSDSLYSTSIIFAFAFLILGLARRRPFMLAMSSLAMAAAVLLRPAGIFLFVVYLMCLAFLAWNRFGWKSAISFAIPLPTAMLLLCTYNLFTLGAFVLTEFGEINIAFATFTFWEQDAGYPPEVNDAIARTQAVMRQQLTADESDALQRSWDFKKLVPVFLKGMHYPALEQATAINGKSDYRATRLWIRRISIDSIRKHPKLYSKFVLTQLWLQYISNIEYQEDFIQFVRNRIIDVYTTEKYAEGKGQPFYLDMAKEFATHPMTPFFSVSGEGQDAQVVMRQTSASRRLYRYITLVRRQWFSNVFWVYAYIVALLLSTAVLVKSRFHHAGAFIAFVMTISVFGASLVVALCEYGGYRYSYVMEFVYYLPILVLPFLRRARTLESAAHPESPGAAPI
jgi:hypothetical protein